MIVWQTATGGNNANRAGWRRKASWRFSENNLRVEKKKGENELKGWRSEAAAIKKSRVSIHTVEAGDFSKYKFRSRVTHTIYSSVSPPRRETPLKQPALRCHRVFFRIINSLLRTAASLCTLFDPSCHPLTLAPRHTDGHPCVPTQPIRFCSSDSGCYVCYSN